MLLALALVWLVPQWAAKPSQPEPKVSLVIARAVHQKFEENLDCGADADEICMRFPATGEFDHARTLAGKRLSRRFAARIWLHTGLRRIDLTMLVEHTPAGKLEVRAYSFAGKSGLACFLTTDLARFHVTLPNAVPGKEDETCFQL